MYIGPDRVDIYDVLRAPYQTLESYQRMLMDESSYEAQHPAIYQPDRISFTNGVLQARRFSGAAFYEMLVHPAMFAHHNPRHVVVIGFGDGAILREVLKHKTVERVLLLEDKEEWLDLTLKHFPEYQDCSYLGGAGAGGAGTYKSCMDDPRVTTYYGDMKEWFAQENDKPDILFDVIILAEE